jgi:hypothetical protein
MAFAEKVDLVGLARAGLSLRSNGHNASNSVLEIPGSDGSILGDEITGHIKNPTCGYAITGTAQLSGVALGKVYGSNDKPYALSRVHVSTGAGQEPTVEADAVQIEDGATQSICTYAISSITLTPARHALTFGAFTYTESLSLALQTSEYEATCDLSPTTINNDPVASDATGGRETVAVTFWAASETTAPAVTPATGWHVTTDWTCTGADASMFVWTATFTHYLSATQAA